jgi:nitrite reductase (NADH) small subunit/3-phenylpropionate/trans-cinnamate dioxygenase ferredoxin subunit
MNDYVHVGKVADFREGRGTAVRIGDRRVAIFKVGGRLHAIQDHCPHMGASLADGKLDCGWVVCHWHGWKFELTSGQGDQNSKRWLRAQVYELKVEGDEVFLRRPAPRPASRPDDGDEWVPWDDSFLKKD